LDQTQVSHIAGRFFIIGATREASGDFCMKKKKKKSRAGLKPTEKVHTEISHVETASTDELKRELEALTGSSSISEIPNLVN